MSILWENLFSLPRFSTPLTEFIHYAMAKKFG